MKVAVTQSLNCAHRLPGAEMHGHTYRVTVIRESGLGTDGMVLSFAHLREWLQGRLRKLDHRQLEGVIGEPATAERLALWIQDGIPMKVTVRVEVGDDGWVETD